MSCDGKDVGASDYVPPSSSAGHHTDVERLNVAIDHSDASQSDKAEAKSLLEKMSKILW